MSKLNGCRTEHIKTNMKSKSLVKEHTCKKHCDVRMTLYLETDTSGVGLATGSLQVRDYLNCGCYKVADNAMFWPTAFVSKSLSSVE